MTLAIGLSGNARAAISGIRVVAFSRGAVSLSYRGLVATDARGRTLRAWLQLRGRELLLRVQDAGAQYPLRVDPFVQQAELIASDAAQNAQLGYSVAFEVNTIVAGAYNATVNGNAGQGAVYVFVKPNGGWQNATQTAKLTASDGAANDNLGASVAIQGNTIVAGADEATVNGNAGQGAVYVFDKPIGGWQNATQTARLTASDGAANDNLGAAVAIQGNTIVAGADDATLNGNAGQGAVYVFLQPGWRWRSETETAKLTASDGAANDLLGISVAIQGNTIVAGAFGATVDGNQFQGAVYVFLQPRWGWRSESETAKLTASDGAANDLLGVSVAIQGNAIVAGASGATVNGNQYQGAVYVFLQPRRGWGNETESAKLTASHGGADDSLGASVAIQRGTIVAGAPYLTVSGSGYILHGAEYLFVRPIDGWRSELSSAELTGSDLATVGGLGNSLAIEGKTIVAGAPLSTENSNPNSFEGAVFAFVGRNGSFQTAAVNPSPARDANTQASLRPAALSTRSGARQRTLAPRPLSPRSHGLPRTRSSTIASARLVQGTKTRCLAPAAAGRRRGCSVSSKGEVGVGSNRANGGSASATKRQS